MSTDRKDAAEGPRLSLDVLFLICEESPKQTVASLCRVSRALLPFAQRRLFHTVDLVGASTIVTTRSWCAAVLRHTDLAKRVHSLSLQPEDGATMDREDAAQISAAVNGCTNLKILRVYGPVFSSSANWMLTSGSPYPFQLVEFTNSYFTFASLASFLATQNELLFLVSPDGLNVQSYIHLPKLSTLVGVKTSAAWPLPRDWPLQRIEMSLTYHGLSGLAFFPPSLTTLNLLNKDYTPDSFSGMLLPLSPKLTNLEHLALVDVERHTAMRPGTSPAQLTGLFCRLRTFTLISRGASEFSDHSGRCFRASHEPDMHAMAMAALNESPTLYRVVIGTEAQKMVEGMYIATKSSDGEVEMVVEEKIDFEAVSMFWV